MPLTPQMIDHVRHWSRHMAWMLWIGRLAAERWRFRNTLDGWTALNATLEATPNGLLLEPSATDPIFRRTGLSFSGADHRYFIIDVERIAPRPSGTWDGKIFYVTGGHGESASFYKQFDEIGMGRHLIVADMHALTVGGTDWQSSTITAVRFDLDHDTGGAFIIHGVHIGDPDLYLWSGSHHLTYLGRTWYGYGYLARMESVRQREGVEHVEQVFELNGLDPTIIADLDESVRGRPASIWLAGIADDRQVVRDPLLLSDTLIQDTLGWTYSLDGSTVTLRLTAHDALPFLGRIKGTKWSNESQQVEFSGDTGFKYNAAIALQGPAITWTQ